MLCPICKTGTLKKGETQVYCENYKPKKDANGAWINEGSCDFRIIYKNKIFGEITSAQVKELVEGKSVKNKKSDLLSLDLDNPHFTKITFAEKKPDDDL